MNIYFELILFVFVYLSWEGPFTNGEWQEFHQPIALAHLIRVKRKVIPRGTHFIINSKSAAPWTSSLSNFSPSNFETDHDGKKKGDSYGGESRGLVFHDSKFDSRYSSSTLRSYVSLPKKKVPPKPERQKINRGMKEEIAKYAIKYSTSEAAKRYQKHVGRQLRERVIEKFVRQHKKRQAKKTGRSKHNGH